MDKSFIIYTSEYATSICSAAIANKFDRSAKIIDIFGLSTSQIKGKLKSSMGEGYSKAFVFAEVVDLIPENKGEKATIIYSSKGKTLDGNYNKRCAVLWKTLFPDFGIPIVVHYVTGLQIEGQKATEGYWLKLAVLAEMHDQIDGNGVETGTLGAWLNMLNEKDQDTLLVRDLVFKGKSIAAYLKRFKSKAKEVKAEKPKVEVNKESTKKKSKKKATKK